MAEEILETNNALAAWLAGRDQIIVDESFRDTIEVFQDLEYETHIPALLKRGEKQHSRIVIERVKVMYESEMVSRKLPWKAEEIADSRRPTSHFAYSKIEGEILEVRLFKKYYSFRLTEVGVFQRFVSRTMISELD